MNVGDKVRISNEFFQSATSRMQLERVEDMKRYYIEHAVGVVDSVTQFIDVYAIVTVKFNDFDPIYSYSELWLEVV